MTRGTWVLQLFFVGAMMMLATNMTLPSAMAANTVAGCQMFPKDNWWNTKVRGSQVDPRSKTWINTESQGRKLWLGYTMNRGVGQWGTPGVPLNIVPRTLPGQRVYDAMWGVDSGLYPIPSNPRLQNPTDRHMLIVQRGTCRLFELWQAKKTDRGWQAGQASIWDLNSNARRAEGDTSTDAAGFPFAAGIIRRDEINKPRIEHALRISLPDIQRAWIWPATHTDGNKRGGVKYPPMGTRFRLRADVNINQFKGHARKVAIAMRDYGVFLADSSGPTDKFYSGFEIYGEADLRWNEQQLEALHQLQLKDFVAVKNTHPIITPDW